MLLSSSSSERCFNMDLHRTVRREIHSYIFKATKLHLWDSASVHRGNSQDWKWTGSTVISVSQREGQTLLCQAVDTSTVKHAFSLVRQICVQMIPLHSLTTKHRGSDKTHNPATLKSCDYFFPTEQCSVCGASCSYLPITDEVGEFIDVFAAEYCLMSPVEDDVTLQKWLSVQILNFRWNHRKWCFSKTLLSSSNRGWSTFHRSVSSVKRYPKAVSLLLFVNCYSGMLNVRAVSQLTSSLWVIQQEISPVWVILKALSFKALAIHTWVVW